MLKPIFTEPANPVLFSQFYMNLCAQTAELAYHFKVGSSTYLLTMNLLDRAVSNIANNKKLRLRLLSCTCLLIACKISEIYVSL